jgi:glycosyltransferase involved in cell wall biosynthesis
MEGPGLRALWFTNVPLPEAVSAIGRRPSPRGGWIPALAVAAHSSGKVEVHLASVVGNAPGSETVSPDGVTQHWIEEPADPRELTLRPGPRLMGQCREIFDRVSPDLVHVHGSEYFFGLLTAEGLLPGPSVLSLQGLVSECAKFYLGGMGLREILRCQSLYGLLRGFGLLHDVRRWEERAREMEGRVLAGQKNFIGRTLWDRAHSRAANPTARYFHCHEVIREPFFARKWSRDRCTPFSIFAATASYPLKGFHWLLRAVAMVRRDHPEVRIRVADDRLRRTRWKSYSNFVLDLAAELGLGDRVDWVGSLGPEEMAAEFERAHCFATASLVENESNSLHEAMIVGTPAVASLAGGMPSGFTDRVDTLGFPPSDEAALAECIRMIFSDDGLARSLSEAARATARGRHASREVAGRLVGIYREILEAT